MTAPRDLDRELAAFLRDGPTELPDPSFDAVRDRMESTRQRVVLGPWRVPDMSKFVPYALGAAAVVVALAVGIQFLRPAQPSGPAAVPSVQPSAMPSPTPTATPTASPTPRDARICPKRWQPAAGHVLPPDAGVGDTMTLTFTVPVGGMRFRRLRAPSRTERWHCLPVPRRHDPQGRSVPLVWTGRRNQRRAYGGRSCPGARGADRVRGLRSGRRRGRGLHRPTRRHRQSDRAVQGAGHHGRRV